jgi:hypothetical protein
MNEHIKELWQQAADSTAAFPSGQNNSWETQVNFMEKFAELIVQECANVIADDDLAKDCGTIMMDSYAKGMRYSAHLIKEHFGVE